MLCPFASRSRLWRQNTKSLLQQRARRWQRCQPSRRCQPAAVRQCFVWTSAEAPIGCTLGRQRAEEWLTDMLIYCVVGLNLLTSILICRQHCTCMYPSPVRAPFAQLYRANNME
eukprot:3239649-Pleurochrysis_carterae.AAC.1